MNQAEALYEEVKHHPSISELSTLPVPPSYDSVVESRKICLKDCTGTSNYKYMIRYENPDTLFSEYGVANIQVHGKWKWAMLSIGGAKIEQLYINGKTNSFDITHNHKCVPFAKFHKIELAYTPQGDVSQGDVFFTYDIVNVSGGNVEEMNFAYQQQEFTGTEKCNVIKGETFYLQSHFVHPISSIRVYSSIPIFNVNLHARRDKHFNIPLNQVSETEWEYSFGDKPVSDIGYIDRLYVSFECDTDTTVSIDTIMSTFNQMRALNGMYGSKYNK